jgi:hypothetical protein
MDVICRTKQTLIKKTNVRKKDVFVLPYDSLVRNLVEQSLSSCIHENTFLNNEFGIEYGMNIAAFPTNINLPYIISQVFKDNVLHKRLDYPRFKRRLSEYKLPKDMVNRLFGIMIRLRMFEVMHDKVHVLVIRRPMTWDVHFVKQLHEHVVPLDFALTDPRMRSFLLQHKRLFKSSLEKFIRHMVQSRVGFTKDLVAMPHFWHIGSTSLNVELAVINDVSYYMALAGDFDSHTIRTFYKHQVDDILDTFKFPKLFTQDVRTFHSTYSTEYMIEVLKHVPDMWEKAVTESFKKNVQNLDYVV